MTTVTISWKPPVTPAAQDVLTLLAVSPIHVRSGTMSAVVVSGEPFEAPPGEAISMTIDLPRLKTVRERREVPAGDPVTLAIDTDELLKELADHETLTSHSRGLLPRTSRGELPPGRSKVKSVTVDINKGLRRLAPIAASLFPRRAALAGADSGVAVSGSQPVSLSARVASRKTLPRIMMIPYAGPEANECRIVPVTPVGAPTRLRVEPADPAATLLMDYLIAGKLVLACAAARAVEKYRADGNPSEWANPSYCQLLIGYSYALGRDKERLDRWCRRTDAAGTLGTDGLVLAAEAARLQLDEATAAGVIERAAGAPPPLLTHGADIGLRIANLLLAELDEPPSAEESASADQPVSPGQPASESPSWIPSDSQVSRLRQVRREFARLLFVADAESSSLSIPTVKDPRATLNVSRFRDRLRRIRNWLAVSVRRRYPVANEHPTQKRQYLVGAAMTSTSVATTAGSGQATKQDGSGQNAKATTSGGSSSWSKLSGPALWVAIFAVVVWVGFSIAMLFYVSKNETEWTRVAWVFGSIQSVAFAAAGALFGTAVQQQNVSSAKQEAATAKKDADDQRDTATKGRALAAVMQADGAAPSAGAAAGAKPMAPGQAGTTESAEVVRQRHAQLSESLFGPLVGPDKS